MLKNFSEYNGDGAWPYETLLVDGQTLYGTTVEGGNTNQGVVFKVFTDGSDYTVLKYFNQTDGFMGYGRLVLSSNKLFGVAGAGGTNNGGVVFSLTVPPQVLVGDGNFGVQLNGFGFNVTGISNQTAVLEACPDLLRRIGWRFKPTPSMVVPYILTIRNGQIIRSVSTGYILHEFQSLCYEQAANLEGSVSALRSIATDACLRKSNCAQNRRWTFS